jgi:predicted transposase/invertase (TIGR01784 family)
MCERAMFFSPAVSTPHDKFFKAVFSGLEHAQSELAAILPASIVRTIDWGTLMLLSGDYADLNAESMESDLLFKAQLEGHDALLYLLFEHQSSVDRTMPFRLLRYMTRIWARFAKDAPNERLPVIIPLVLHHGERGWAASTKFRELLHVPEPLAATLAPFIPDFTYVLDDLSMLDDHALRNRALTDLARIALVVLQRCRDSQDPAAILRPWIQTLLAVLAAPDGREALQLVARYTAEASDAEPELIYRFFIELGPEAEEIVMSTADRIREQGRHIGVAEGRAQGVAATLTRLLTLRFGPLSPAVLDRIHAAAPAELERWTDLVLTAPSLEDVLEG